MVAHIKGRMPVLKDLACQLFVINSFTLTPSQEPVSPWSMLLAHLCSDLRDMLGSVLIILRKDFTRVLMYNTTRITQLRTSEDTLW